MNLTDIQDFLRARTRAPAAPPIGCELGPDRMHLVQLERRAGRVQLRAAGSLSFGSAGELKTELSRALRQGGFRSRRVVACMPPERVRLVVVNYKPSDDQPEAQQVLERLAERIPQGLDECVIDYRPIATSGAGGEASVLVAVAREADAIEHLDRLYRAGLTVEALEVAALALARLVPFLRSRASEANALVLNFGRERAELLALWDRQLVLYHELDMDEGRAVETISAGLEVEPDMARSLLYRYGVTASGGGDAAIARTVRELLRASFQDVATSAASALAYTASRMQGAGFQRAYVMGLAAAWPGVGEMLEPLLDLPVEMVHPLQALGGDAEPSARDADLNVAAGLALRGVQA